MVDAGASAGWPADQKSRFDLTPPRHFLLPAVLLLLSEEAGYGYNLARRLAELRFGHVDRPSVYRALAQLEGDGLVESSPGRSKAGQERRVYEVTEQGERALRAWMGVIKDERDRLDGVLRRYMATGTIDAILAEAEGGWPSVTGRAWSPVSSTSPIEGHRWRRPLPSEADRRGTTPTRRHRRSAAPIARDAVVAHPLRRFRLVPERSVALIEARSTVGPITFGAIGVTGTIAVELHDGAVASRAVRRRRTSRSTSTTCGPGTACTTPSCTAASTPAATRSSPSTCGTAEPSGTANRYRLAGDMTLHGVTPAAAGNGERHPDRAMAGSWSAARRSSTSGTSTSPRRPCSCCGSTPTCGCSSRSRPSRRTEPRGAKEARWGCWWRSRRVASSAPGRAARTSATSSSRSAPCVSRRSSTTW